MGVLDRNTIIHKYNPNPNPNPKGLGFNPNLISILPLTLTKEQTTIQRVLREFYSIKLTHLIVGPSLRSSWLHLKTV